MKICGIYKITSPSNCIYIGQSIDCVLRIKAYSRYQCKSQKRLFASLKKYGFQNHKFEILIQCGENELSKMEKYYVDLFNSFNSEKGLNIRDGGGNSARLSEEQKMKISQSLKGKRHSKERIEKNRLGQLGKKLSESHKEKIRINSAKFYLGKKLSEQHKIKLSEAHKGQVSNMKGKNHSEETKNKLKILSSGINNPNYGKPRSAETKRKISETLKNKK